MTYFRLNDDYAFRGWKYLPFAIRSMVGEKAYSRPLFTDKETFLALLSCNGQEEVQLDTLPKPVAENFENLLKAGILQSSNEKMKPLEPWQRYKVYPSIYLDSIHWSITGKCNYKCRHCLLSAPTNCHPQLPLSDCLKIVEQMHTCGIRCVELTGGEPFVRSDFIELVKALTANEISIRTIFTNASLLSEELLDALDRLDQHPVFQLSYDGLGHHSWLRGIDHAEEEVQRGIEMLSKRHIPYTCAMCIHKENADSLRDTVNYLAAHGCISLRLNTPQELGTWKEYSEKYALTWMEAWEIYKAYIPQYFQDGIPMGLELDGFLSCNAHSTKYTIPYAKNLKEGTDLKRVPYCESMKYNAYIDAEGRLVPCMGFADTAIKDQFPSLLKDDLANASWNSYYTTVVKTNLQDLVDHNPECKECEHLLQCCGGCMVEGTTPEGNYFHYDPHSCWFHKNIGEAAVRQVTDAAIETYAADLKKREEAEAKNA